MEEISSIDTSGFIVNPFRMASENFSDYTLIETDNYCLLYKVKINYRWYFLKGLKEQYRDNDFYVKLLNNEFETGIMMNHPNILKVVNRKNDSVVGDCIVMEYVDSISLKEFMKTNHSRQQYEKIVREILNAMAHFHSREIVHCNLNSDNILITRNGNNVKIVNFGFSDPDVHAALKNTAAGTKYAAPEQLDTTIIPDCRADIYAFGLILKQIFPHRYRAIAAKCSKLKRENRYQNVSEIQYAIAHYHRKLWWLMLIPFLFLLFLIITNPFKNNGNKKSVALPKVTTSNISNITQSSATSVVQVNNVGGAPITVSGVCWSTNKNPTIQDSHSLIEKNSACSITRLSAGTTYYVRAYATNIGGTAYGRQMVFHTLAANGKPCIDAETVKDYDGNVYNTMQIGNQCWMRESMRTTRYADGTPIPLGNDTNSSHGYRSYYNDNINTILTYGYLYNLEAVMRSAPSSNSVPSGIQGICPNGWHVPSISEFNYLYDYMVSNPRAYNMGWKDSASGAIPYMYNENLFSTMPPDLTSFCSTSIWSNKKVIYALFVYENSSYNFITLENKHLFLPVRCLRD